MTFTSGGQFEGGRVRRGSGAKVAAGAGALGGGGILALILSMLLGGGGGGMGDLLGSMFGTGQTSAQVVSCGETIGDCTADQANTDAQCELSATVQSLDAYWAVTLPAQAGVQATMPDVVSFDGSVSTACGAASADTGPFYCPSDQTIYIDVSFYDELVSRFGSSGGPLARKYVVAHEYGHHIENLIGAFNSPDSQSSGATGGSVRIELMADCLAGMWAYGATTTPDPDTGVTFLNPLTEQDIRDALSAASAVGDDRIQQASSGYVDPHTFTHGTSAQRMKWFAQGYSGGTLSGCNTLAATDLG